MQTDTMNAACDGDVLILDSVMHVSYGGRVAMLRGRSTIAAHEGARQGFVIFMRRGHQWAEPHEADPFEVADLRAVVSMLRCKMTDAGVRLAFDFSE
ncbi:MAG: Imm74 family immunity protein [Rhodocyclaceae bacterium]